MRKALVALFLLVLASPAAAVQQQSFALRGQDACASFEKIDRVRAEGKSSTFLCQDSGVPAPWGAAPSRSAGSFAYSDRDAWDVLFFFDGYSSGQQGVETDGINIYSTNWFGPEFYRYGMDGMYIETFQVPGALMIRDMAYNGIHFYGSDDSMTMYVMDLANETLIETFQVSCTGITSVRHIAFDPNLDGGNGGFWIGGVNELGAITMEGAEIHANVANPGNIYGSAYDPFTEGGPYLWCFSQGGAGRTLHQFDIATLSFTGVTHDASDIPGAEGIAGGAATYVNGDGIYCLLVLIQQDPDLFGVYELAIAAEPEAPGAPTEVSVTPDAGGALVATIDWICPQVKVNGDRLIELDEIRIYRGTELIHTDSAPVIGEAGTYTDTAVLQAETYLYTVVGHNSFGEGLQASDYSWIGADVPNVVTDLALEDISSDDDLIAHLTWVNPTTGLHGGVFIDPILGYHITRSDGAHFELAGIATEYTDETILVDGYYHYEVQPFNAAGDGGIATSSPVWIGVGFDGIIIIDLDSTPTGSVLQASIQSQYGGEVVLATSLLEQPITEQVAAVFILLGIYSNNARIYIGEETPITDYLSAGGKVYLEGGDVWYYDPIYAGGFDFGPLFGIDALSDGTSDLAVIDGEYFLSGLSWTYTGENSWIDQLAPIAPAETLFRNPEAPYVCGVAHDAGTYKTVGTSFEITGLSGTRLDDAVAGILAFFEVNTTSVGDGSTSAFECTANNFPNPFNPTTSIAFSIPVKDRVTIDVYDVRGRKVRSLLDDVKEAGRHVIAWDGRDEDDRPASTGVYLYKVQSGEYSATRKMTLLK